MSKNKKYVKDAGTTEEIKRTPVIILDVHYPSEQVEQLRNKYDYECDEHVIFAILYGQIEERLVPPIPLDCFGGDADE